MGKLRQGRSCDSLPSSGSAVEEPGTCSLLLCLQEEGPPDGATLQWREQPGQAGTGKGAAWSMG